MLNGLRHRVEERASRISVAAPENTPWAQAVIATFLALTDAGRAPERAEIRRRIAAGERPRVVA
ncbi:MAG TPA: hypothetical protein VF802_04025, partial [Candidatus Limnocylindrales bacterium]